MQLNNRNKCKDPSCPSHYGNGQVFLVLSEKNTVNINILNPPPSAAGLKWAPLLRGIVVGAIFKLVSFFLI
ncbi:hypothetical protein CCL15_12635 [Pseudomonas syringae]|nr:hypothetical protein CCL15_12635 [Pseudomonas syringae]